MQAHLQSGACPLSRPPAADPLRIVHADFLAGAGPGSALTPPVHVEIAFAGRSNVGKSSLINTLVQRKNLVRTSATPGSTRQLNLYETRSADGLVIHLVDLPGYGFSHRSKGEKQSWATLIEGYLGSRPTLAVVVILVDVRRGLEPDDQELVDFIDAAKEVSRRPVQIVLVATKIDKVPRSSRKVDLNRLRATTGRKVFGFSAVTAEGRDELWRALRRAALGEVTPVSDAGAAGSPGEPEPPPPPDQIG